MSAKGSRKTTMTSANGLVNNEGANGSASQLPCDFPLSELRGLDNLKVSKYYPRGSVLFMEGQRPRGIYVLCEGRAKVTIASAVGKTLVLRIAQPGELLGMNATLTGQPYDATVQTLGRCRIDFVSREHLLELLDQDKRAYIGVARSLSRTLTGLVEHARLLLLSQSASEKLARLLMTWGEEHGKRTAQGLRIRPGLTHEEIGQMIGASRETVTRVLNTLKRKHIVRAENGDLLIRNRAALTALTNKSA
jgi:CRP/FNR family transcriptional regulator, cyclic AMP receptor protein